MAAWPVFCRRGAGLSTVRAAGRRRFRAQRRRDAEVSRQPRRRRFSSKGEKQATQPPRITSASLRLCASAPLRLCAQNRSTRRREDAKRRKEGHTCGDRCVHPKRNTFASSRLRVNQKERPAWTAPSESKSGSRPVFCRRSRACPRSGSRNGEGFARRDAEVFRQRRRRRFSSKGEKQATRPPADHLRVSAPLRAKSIHAKTRRERTRATPAVIDASTPSGTPSRLRVNQKGRPARTAPSKSETGRPEISASRTRRPGSVPSSPGKAPRRASARGRR